MKFEIDTDKIVDDIVSEALEREIEGKTIKQWMTEIAEHKWISVKNRLPEKTERYMCLCYDFVTKSYWHEILWYKNNHWWNSLATFEHDYTKHVVYWMPLPEQPKEEHDAENADT